MHPKCKILIFAVEIDSGERVLTEFRAIVTHAEKKSISCGQERSDKVRREKKKNTCEYKGSIPSRTVVPCG
jgi:hypothetical protein